MPVMPTSIANLRELQRRQRLLGGAAVRPSASAFRSVPGAEVRTPAPPEQFSTDPNSIVTVFVQTIVAPTPNTYQQTGCFVSYGGTDITPHTVQQLTQYSDLTGTTAEPGPLIGSQAIASVAYSAGHITVTTQAPIAPAYPVNAVVPGVVSGFTPAGYNYVGNVTILSATTFSYPITADPGTATVTGVFQSQASIELSQMAFTFFSQGNMTTVWVLELGVAATPQAQADALSAWLAVNPTSFYGYLLPRAVGSDSATLAAFTDTVFKGYAFNEAMTYFWITVTPSTMPYIKVTLGSPLKNIIQFVEAPTLTDSVGLNVKTPTGEFSEAAMFYNAMAYLPSNINPVAPMAYKYLIGTTAYPTQNNGVLLTQFKQYSTNYVATGAEGGIGFNIVYEGVTLDGNDYFNWWWTIDWVQINVNLNLSNAVINGSNNALAPLYYNQAGINYLETVLYNTMNSAATFGMILGKLTMTELDGPALTNAINQGTFAGQCDVNAVPFLPYTLANPGDYKIGRYAGLSTLFIPARGFIHILVYVTASSLVSV